MTRHENNNEQRKALELGSDIIGAMDKEFHDAPDRVLAVVGAAYLDSLLEELLRAIFVEGKQEANQLLDPDRPLGSNGARYQLAYCLGLIEKHQRDDLKMISRIRNAFAHKYNVRSFEQEEARNMLAKLHYGKEIDSIIAKLIQDTPDKDSKEHLRKIGQSGRKKFQDTVRNLFVSLLQKLDSVARPNKATWYPK